MKSNHLLGRTQLDISAIEPFKIYDEHIEISVRQNNLFWIRTINIFLIEKQHAAYCISIPRSKCDGQSEAVCQSETVHDAHFVGPKRLLSR
jgi:hypothetical protein